MFGYATDAPRLLVLTDKNKKEFNRGKAHGYKKITCQSVGELTPVEFKSNGDTLEIVDTQKPVEKEVFCIQCSEFGVIGYKGNKENNFLSDLGVIFCDNGEMFVTLYKGAIFLRLNDEVVMPTTEDMSAVSYTQDDILWINADRLLSFGKCLYDEGRYMYDREYAFTLAGCKRPLETFTLRPHRAEDIDLSQGYLETVELEKRMKEAKMENKKIMNNLISKLTEKKSVELDMGDLDDGEEVTEEE